MSEQNSEAVEPSPEAEISLDDALGETYDRMQAEEAGPARDEKGRFVAQGDDNSVDGEPVEAGPEDAEAAEEAPEQADEESDETGEPEKIEAPAHLPQSIKEAWKDMPAAARDAVAKHQQEMDRKFSQQGRMLQAVQPIANRLSQAVTQYPQFLNMTPDELAEGAVRLAAVQQELENDPVNTVLKVAEQYGVAEHLRAYFNGQQPSDQSNYIAGLQREIRELKQSIEKGTGSIDDRISAAMEQRETASIVERFASEQPLWGDVEPYLPQFIRIARETAPEAPPAEQLKSAYDMAIHAIPELRAKAGATGKAAPKTDPDRAAKARKATSVNLKPTAGGKERARTVEETLSEAFDRLQAG